jgi:hypothetical protein
VKRVPQPANTLFVASDLLVCDCTVLVTGAWVVWRVLIFFKLEEEENTALLLHLPKLVVETIVFGSASGSGCRVVVELSQA